MANGDERFARLLGTATGALVAAQLASAVLGKRKAPDAEEAVQVYQEILAQLRKASAVGKQDEAAED